MEKHSAIVPIRQSEIERCQFLIQEARDIEAQESKSEYDMYRLEILKKQI
jgi:hypothetical protein